MHVSSLINLQIVTWHAPLKRGDRRIRTWVKTSPKKATLIYLTERGSTFIYLHVLFIIATKFICIISREMSASFGSCLHNPTTHVRLSHRADFANVQRYSSQLINGLLTNCVKHVYGESHLPGNDKLHRANSSVTWSITPRWLRSVQFRACTTCYAVQEESPSTRQW